MSIARSPSSSEPAAPASHAPLGWLARWLPVAVWALCISWFSTEAFSARSTHRYIDPVLRYLFGPLSPEAFRFAHAVIRKSAHFLEYGVLAVLIVRALAIPPARPHAGMLLRAVAYCALYATADEVHQAFEATRTGSPSDVAIDVAGAAVGVLFVAWWGAASATKAKRP